MAEDFSGLYPGAIAFAELGSKTVLGGTGVATKNFCIALGRPNGQVPFLIPEVDIHSLTVTKSVPVDETRMTVTITMPDPDDVVELVPTTSLVTSPFKEYGIVFIKKGTVPHERNTYTVQIQSQVDTDALLATAMVKAINDKHSEGFPFTAEVSNSTKVAVTCDHYGQDWEVKFIDSLEGINLETKTATTSGGFVTGYTSTSVVYVAGRKAIGDKADIQDLASRCAAGKGFTDTYRNGDTIYPGYPEEVDDRKYNVYTLRFRVGRDSAKTRDERVWQIVHIAVPTTYSTNSANSTFIGYIDAMLPTGKYMNAVMDAIGDKSVTDAAAAAADNG